ncbi:TrkA C-terminal domain-containing protein [Clostridium ganghwense]|uniref:GntR family transcriptional regulator n=1 Tax=Clostridium ganghwense TaxID=312089 RepID=A0ABT4CLS9_9CLOT|nr:TrkA C-terminal domain-containing protein [Clostridium ganghwense]MCY6369999.1 GntR family transcriptional regulator [Clostridium ganghwense]
MVVRTETPRYNKIAVDIAGRIYKGQLLEGEKLRGRSVLACEYNVSPETIRKAVKLLEDKKVVEVSKGKGVIILSSEKAHEFVSNFKEKESIGTLRNTIKKLLEERKSIEYKIQEINEKLIDYSYKYSSYDLIQPREIEIRKDIHIIGKSIGESRFWQNTGATILGVRRNNKVIISPGPYLEFEEDDIILVVGEEEAIQRIYKYLKY